MREHYKKKFKTDLCMFKYSSVNVPIFKEKSFKGILESIILTIACVGVQV